MAGIRTKRRRRLSGASIDGQMSPRSRMNSPGVNASFVDLPENDDNKERKQTRKSRARRRSLAVTPINGSNRSRRGSSPFGSNIKSNKKHELSQHELSKLYQNVIKLSQHGKISSKNAWELKLTDHIDDVIEFKSDDTDNDTNKENNDMNISNISTRTNKYNKHVTQYNAAKFVKASHTIDAATKIYGYRVDSVHTETYKVLGALHNNDDKVRICVILSYLI